MTVRKQLAVGALVLAIVVAVAYGATRYLRHELFPVELGTKAPDFTAFTLDSVPKEKRLADYRGQVLMVNVWATWCLDCERDQPGFVRVAGRYAGKDVAFLGVNPEETSTAQPTAWVRRYGVPYPSIEDPSGRFAASLGYTGLPATYVVDRAGTIRYSIIGSTTSEATLSSLIDRTLSGDVSRTPTA